MKKFIFILFGLLFASSAFAVSIGSVSDSLLGPLDLLTKLMVVMSYVVGAVLVAFGLVQYKTHRQNPKLVPLSVPIILFFCGGILLLLPYLTDVFGDSWSISKQDEHPVEGSDFVTGNEGRYSYPNPPEEEPNTNPEEEYSSPYQDRYDDEYSSSY